MRRFGLVSDDISRTYALGYPLLQMPPQDSVGSGARLFVVGAIVAIVAIVAVAVIIVVVILQQRGP